MTTDLHIEDVSKTYGSIKALDCVSLDLEGGRVAALVGVNGSGKTTLLRILAGLEEPDTGSILVDSKTMEMKELRRISTMVFQKTLMFNTTVYDNVSYGLRFRGLQESRIQHDVSKAIESVGLAGFKKRKARGLSGGEQQRVALARAFVLEPSILLLDEPTANIDPANAFIVEEVIKKIREREVCTVIFATHNLHQAKRLSDTIVHIHHGTVLEKATATDFFTCPDNEITKKFVNGELQF